MFEFYKGNSNTKRISLQQEIESDKNEKATTLTSNKNFGLLNCLKFIYS